MDHELRSYVHSFLKKDIFNFSVTFTWWDKAKRCLFQFKSDLWYRTLYPTIYFTFIPLQFNANFIAHQQHYCKRTVEQLNEITNTTNSLSDRVTRQLHNNRSTSPFSTDCTSISRLRLSWLGLLVCWITVKRCAKSQGTCDLTATMFERGRRS